MKINIVLPRVLPAWSSSWKSDTVYVMYSLPALNCFLLNIFQVIMKPQYYQIARISVTFVALFQIKLILKSYSY